jgi:TPR repeat protein
MRISDVVASISLLALAVGLSPAVSFDGSRQPDGAAVVAPLPGAASSLAPVNNSVGGTTSIPGGPTAPVAPAKIAPRSTIPASPQEALRSGTQALRQGRTDEAVMDLEYAAEQGVPGALWKLGRMYADGDGVKVDKARAYDLFRRLTALVADDTVQAPNARFLANAFVTLGLYHLEGIPGTLAPDPTVAQEMFRYAASYYADPEAQYHLGRLYLLGKGAPKDAIQAARWLRLSANKGDHRAQALLGGMLFKGEEVSRQAALGLFWLIIAKDGAGPEEGWITDMYSNALAQASESERAMAHKYLEDWLKKRRE